MSRLFRRSGPNWAAEPLEGRSLLSGLAHHPAVAAPAPHPPSPPSSPDRWAWLADTYWYVPTSGLPAVVYDASSGALAPVSDQTVYHISSYRGGYFWGETVTQLDSAAPTSSALVGSVTPSGKLLLFFTHGSGTTEGFGTMTRQRGRWTMTNQMFTGSSGGEVGHWANMTLTRPGMASWNALPGVGVSVPTFLANYAAPVPTPVGS
jgi:hypothetical protein